jgi:hypothetical protein
MFMPKTASEIFRFEPVDPRPWLGRYKRPKGEESAYHVGVDNRIEVRWKDGDDDLTSPVEATPGAQQLAKAVNAVKRKQCGLAGGSFVINEFGQVLCPIQKTFDRFLVGHAAGLLRFEDASEDGVYRSIGEDSDLVCGDEWNLPYIGMQYQLAAGGWIYFWRDGKEQGGSDKPPRQDEALIERLRGIRPHGAVRFIVNHHGIVLTKKPIDNSTWKAIYVGRINLDLWFQREE